jgi:hypothetical protein
MAMNLIDAGVDEQTAMMLTGHQDRETFRAYNRIVLARKTAAAARLTDHLREQGQLQGHPRPPRKPARVTS